MKSRNAISNIASSLFRQFKKSTLTLSCDWIVFLSKSFVFSSFAKIIEFYTTVKYLGPQKGEKICDLGCGYGSNDVLLSLTQARVYGVDIDRNTLNCARDNARRLEANVNYCVSDLNSALCFKSASFDKVVSYCVLEHLNDPVTFLNEVNRVLRPEGVLVLSVDSFSCHDIRDEFIDMHKKVCEVKKYYTKRDAEQLLNTCNFSLERASFVIRARASGFLFEALLRAYFRSEIHHHSLSLKVFKLFTPIALLISVISDRLCKQQNRGYWLLLLVVKQA